MRAGVDGLLRDKTRPSRIPPLRAETAERVVALTLAEPPGEATHWTAGAMAEAVGISASSVRCIWCSHGLQPACADARSRNSSQPTHTWRRAARTYRR